MSFTICREMCDSMFFADEIRMQFLTSIALAVLTALSAVDAAAAIEGYVRTETVDYNGHAGVRFITYSRSRAKAALFKFDLTKGFRIRVWHGDTNASGAKRSALGAMAENLRTETGVVPIAGINGDYFNVMGLPIYRLGRILADFGIDLLELAAD